MGIRNELQTELADVFNNDLADAVNLFIGTRKIEKADDWTHNTAVGTTTTYTGRGVKTSFDTALIDGELIKQQDVLLICLQNEVTEPPRLGDTIDGQKVLHVRVDPVNATFEIQLREV